MLSQPTLPPQVPARAPGSAAGGVVALPDSRSPWIETSVSPDSRDRRTCRRVPLRATRNRTSLKSPLNNAFSQPAALTCPVTPERLATFCETVPVNTHPNPVPLTAPADEIVSDSVLFTSTCAWPGAFASQLTVPVQSPASAPKLPGGAGTAAAFARRAEIETSLSSSPLRSRATIVEAPNRSSRARR